MNENKYVRTDLAAESPVLKNGRTLSGIKVTQENCNSCEITTVEVLTAEGENLIGKPIGTYITVSFGNINSPDEDVIYSVSDTVADIIKKLSNKLLINTKSPSALIVGLGNRNITPDAIGPFTAKKITVTRHIKNSDERIFDLLKMHCISAISPGVSGQTGIESYDIVKSTVDTIKPDIVLAIDALASRSVDRLATTIQLSDSGIAPGSGIGNHKKALNKTTLGIPVIALGVPTMVSSSTLVYDALEKAGVEEIQDELRDILNDGKSFYVTLNECDLVVNRLSELIANAINTAFSK